jgi:hypothetical protein
MRFTPEGRRTLSEDFLTDAEMAEPLPISLEEVVALRNRAYRRASPKALLSTEEASVLYEDSHSLTELTGVDRTRSHTEFHEPEGSGALGERHSKQCLAGKKQSG